MSNAITVVSSWSSEYVAEIFLKPVFTSEDIMGTYGIDPTVNRSKTLYLGDDLKRIIQKKSGCSVSPSGTFALGEKTITTEPCAVNLEVCASEFYNTVFKQNLKRGSDIYDLGGTVLEQTMVENVTTALQNDIFELCWFGDVSISSTALTFFKTFDGWFKKLEASSGVQKVTVGSSTGLGTDQALNVLREMYKKGDVLRGVKPSERVFLVTDSMYTNLLETHENTALDSGLKRLEEDKPLVFRGIPVEPQVSWDNSLATLSPTTPNRAVYTKKENLIIGTDIRKPGSDAKLFLDELTEKFYFKANFDLGVQYLFDDHVIYAR